MYYVKGLVYSVRYSYFMIFLNDVFTMRGLPALWPSKCQPETKFRVFSMVPLDFYLYISRKNK